MSNKTLKGGEFLVKETAPNEIFITEDFNEEQRMMAQSCKDFIDSQVAPFMDQLEKHNRELLRKMLQSAGELGLLGISIPEEYDGMGQNFATSMFTSEEIGKGNSFSVAYTAHTGIGTLPIMYYGNEAQKKKYIPKLVSGEYIGSYCLTEANAGSDANSGKTKAVLSEDGTYYTIDGVKIWITNGGIADILIVFAKIGDDKNLSAFIVESTYSGVKAGPEEHKMGIKGSSTVQIYLDNVKVPAENLLGERNGGFKIALNILNLGRIKLAGSVLGAAKWALQISTNYANERKQFGKLISSFGAIKTKLADCVIDIFALDSLTYRICQNVDDAAAAYVAGGMEKGKASIEAMRQYAIEASIAKVYGSEVLDRVVDEGVQIHGGMGYSAESLIERGYRDSRINRIFEGTNEINRMVVVGEIVKRAMAGELDMMEPAKAVAKELMEIPEFGSLSLEYFEEKRKIVKNFKKTILMIAGAALKKYMMAFAEEQEIIMFISDMTINTYVAESMVLRVEKLQTIYDSEKLAIYKDMLDVFIYDMAAKINKFGVDAVNAFAQGDEQAGMLMGMKRFTKVAPVNTVEIRRKVANKLIEDNMYKF